VINVTGAQVDEALANTTHVRFLPPNPLYYLTRVKEIFGRFFSSSSVERAEFDFLMSSKRLKEAYLLSKQDRINLARDVLYDYDKSTKSSIAQLNKARSQNQEILPAVDEIIGKLKYHETLIKYLATEVEHESGESAISSFKNYVYELERLKPDIKNRFDLAKEDNEDNSGDRIQMQSPSPAATPNFTFETTGGARPKRILY
jgi:hypothetical protein